jgi:hypothetical protein
MQKRIFRLVSDVTVPEGVDTIDYQPKDRFASFDTRIPLTGLWLFNKNTGDVDAILSCQCLIQSEECYVTLRPSARHPQAGLHVLYETTLWSSTTKQASGHNCEPVR